jgi:hypothetical protein
MSQNTEDIPEPNAQVNGVGDHSIAQESIIGSGNVEDSADADSPHTVPSVPPVVRSTGNHEGSNDLNQVLPIRQRQNAEELAVVTSTAESISDTGNQLLNTMCTEDDLPNSETQLNSRSVAQVPRARRIVGYQNEEHAEADAAVHIKSWKTGYLPNYKDQVNPSAKESAQAELARTIPSPPHVVAANGPDFEDQVQHARPQENSEEPPVIDARVEAVTVTVIPMPEVIHITDSQLRDEESMEQVRPPQITAVSQQRQKHVIARLRRRYATYLLISTAVLIAAVMGGLACAGQATARAVTAVGKRQQQHARVRVQRKRRHLWFPLELRLLL